MEAGYHAPGFSQRRRGHHHRIALLRLAHAGVRSRGEPDWTEKDKPCILGRKPFGRVTISNSDAGGEAYLDCAIDQAYRAVEEIGKHASRTATTG